MLIIKNNYSRIPTSICDACGSEFILSPEDYNTEGSWTCPLCGYTNDKMITVQSFKYPDDFKSDNAAKIDDEKINEWIRNRIDYLRKHPNDFMTFETSGDALVVVTHEHNSIGYNVYIGRDIEEAFILED